MANRADYQFVDSPPPSLQCPVCCDVFHEPHLLGCCGKHLCANCLDRIKRDKKPCPFCNESDFQVLLDKSERNKVFELQVKCPNSELGCTWKGELAEVEHGRHQRRCLYEVIPCGHTCGERIQRRLIQQHEGEECPLRPFQCEYCRYSSTYDKVVNEHQPSCDFFPVSCPNNCGIGRMPCHSLEDHLKECPREMVDCEYRSIGCLIRRPRKDVPGHMNVQQNYHIHLVFRHSMELQRKLAERDEETRKATEQAQQLAADFRSMQETMAKIDLENQVLRQEISEVRRKYTEQKEGSQREIETLQHEVATLRNQQTEEELQAMKHESHELKRTMAQKITELKQMQQQQQQQREVDFEEKFAKETQDLRRDLTLLEREQKQQANQVEQLQQSRGNDQSLKEDIRQIRRDVKYVERCITPQPSVHFTMNRYPQRKRDEEPFYSPPFYSHDRGYKMFIRVDANGSGDSRGRFLSVFCCILRGEHDSHLEWPFRGDVHIRLLNMRDGRNYIEAIISYGDKTPDSCAKRVLTGDKNYLHTSSDAVKFVSHARLSSSAAGFVDGGALDFEVTQVYVKH